MKIGIDARLFGTKHGGIGRYTEKLITELEKIDSQNQYVIFLQKNNFDEYQPKNSNFIKVSADFRAYSLQEQVLFSGVIKKQGIELMHFTHFNVPLWYRGKFIVTIHDLIISHYPDSRATTLNPMFYRLKLFLYDIVVKSAARRAQKIIAVSEFTKKDIVKFLHVDPDKITVTYEGCDMPRDVSNDCLNFLEDKGIRPNFLLYVGSAYPHKNLEKLLEAFKKATETGLQAQLVLVGSKNYFYQQIEQKIHDLGLNGRVVMTGYCQDNELACLYKNARAYVFPSRIEGFGLPPLEAQTYGIPVISSQATCLPEILGDSALFFNPESVDDMSRAIVQIMTDEDLRRRLAEKGKINTERFSWVECATTTHALYN